MDFAGFSCRRPGHITLLPSDNLLNFSRAPPHADSQPPRRALCLMRHSQACAQGGLFFVKGEHN
jgi:hypothetical protein